MTDEKLNERERPVAVPQTRILMRRWARMARAPGFTILELLNLSLVICHSFAICHSTVASSTVFTTVT